MKTRRLVRTLWVAGLFMPLFALVFAVCTTPAGAQIDPQIYVCTGCNSPPGGDPNVINPASINVGFAGNHTAVSPLLIIVGVPNAGAAPTLSLGTNTAAAAGKYYGLPNNTSGGTSGVLEGTLTALTTGDAYSAVGLSGGDNSNNWSNWSTFDTGKGFIVGTTFNLYAYAINVALNPGPITIDFSGIASGSFVIAYNCAMSGATCTGGDVGSTPFTNAGVVAPGTPVTTPEPNSLLLFGVGILALGLVMRRRLLPGDDASRMSVA